MATGLDEDYRKPKNLADQMVRTLDDQSVTSPDRLRLIALFLLYKDGLLPADLHKLLLHAQLPPQDAEIIRNLELLGARVGRNLKDSRPTPSPLFAQKPPPTTAQEEYALSRFETAVQLLLTSHSLNTIDATTFPYTKPPLDLGEVDNSASATSLRSAKPTWAKSKTTSTEPRQRVIVYMAGGATYSESRACYDVSRQTNKDIFLVTSHMLTPALFMRQVGDLSVDKRRLGIPAEMPKPQAPAHLFEPEEPTPKPQQQQQQQPQSTPKKPMASPQPPMQAMGSLNVGGKNGASTPEKGPSKLTKDPDKDKKKRHFFSSKRS